MKLIIRTLGNIRIFLKKILPYRFYSFILSTWLFLNNKFHFYDNFNFYCLKNFKKKYIKKISYKNISLSIALYPNIGNYQYRQIHLRGKHPELELLDLFLKYIDKNNIVLDIGANIGHHSIFISNIIGEKGKVYAFEPLKSTCDLIVENIQINNKNNIVLENIALGEKDSEIVFYEDKNDTGSSSFIIRHDNVNKNIVKVKTLDSYNFDKIDFMKIDVEGYEWYVLQGAKKTIKKLHPIILLEFSLCLYNKIDKKMGENIINFLIENGYKLLDLDLNKVIKNCQDLEIEMTNILCLFTGKNKIIESKN